MLLALEEVGFPFIFSSDLSTFLTAPAGGANPLLCPQSTTPYCCEASNSCGYTSCQATGSPIVSSTTPPTSNSNAANTGNCSGKLNNQIACTGNSFGICLNGAIANNALQACPAGTVCCEALGQCAYAGCAQAGGYQTITNPVLPPNSNTGTCTGKANGNIACLPNQQFGICSNGGL
ncbi:hypothetical protein HK100_004079 [Physocladia obscura]|uniref:Uncharacterized protein n=1 Tax=Physocladia obscura TaxID=109957 RepID=A0AAD5SU97_9FUNG|nr:hypothetical protein HK100_004079 [Physocladia obscura]